MLSPLNIQYMLYSFVSVAAILITIKYLKCRHLLKYWKDRKISGPKPIIYFGNTLTALLKPMAYTEMEWYNKYGRIYGVYGLVRPALTVAEPALVKQILVKEFHKFRNRMPETDANDKFPRQMFNARDGHWKRLRLIMGPAFTSGKLRRLYPLVSECCAEFAATLDGKLSAATDRSAHAVVDLKQLMTHYVIDVICSAAFATKTHPYSHPNHPFVVKSKQFKAFNRYKDFVAMILPTSVRRSRLWKTMTSSGGESSDMFFARVVRRLMSERREGDEQRDNDFLQLLMDAEDNTDGQTVGAGDSAQDSVADKKLTEQEIVNHCIVFFTAATENQSLTLAFCAYELALNPDIQHRLAAEIEAAAAAGDALTGSDIDYETLLRLPFLDAIVSETLRHYPPIHRLNREPAEDVVLSAGGGADGPRVELEKGICVEIPVYAIHHDPDHYPQPFAFKPDRFLPENRHQIKPYTYIPFGSGPRICVGMRFGMLIIKLLVAKMIQQFRFYAVPDTDIPLIFDVNPFIMAPKRLMVGVDKR